MKSLKCHIRKPELTLIQTERRKRAAMPDILWKTTHVMVKEVTQVRETILTGLETLRISILSEVLVKRI